MTSINYHKDFTCRRKSGIKFSKIY